MDFYKENIWCRNAEIGFGLCRKQVQNGLTHILSYKNLRREFKRKLVPSSAPCITNIQSPRSYCCHTDKARFYERHDSSGEDRSRSQGDHGKAGMMSGFRVHCHKKGMDLQHIQQQNHWVLFCTTSTAREDTNQLCQRQHKEQLNTGVERDEHIAGCKRELSAKQLEIAPKEWRTPPWALQLHVYHQLWKPVIKYR